MNNRWFIPFLFLLVACRSVSAWETLTNDLDLDCTQQAFRTMDCSYRQLAGQKPDNFSASYKKESLPVTGHSLYPSEEDRTAIILLVDTSDPARQPVIEKNREQIRKILDRMQSRHSIGLATFDKGLHLQARPGSSRERIMEAAATLKAGGMITELYRSSIKAVELLAETDAQKKAIYLFSDGLAEDRAYFHEDVVRTARRNNVIINSLGFQRNVGLSVALQSLRRLSEETGGLYIEAGDDYTLPASFLQNPFNNIDRGGRFSIDISALSNLPVQQTEITLNYTLEGKDFGIDIPVSLPGMPAAKTSGPAGGPVSLTPPPVRIVTAPPETRTDNLDRWLWYGVPVTLLILVLLTIVTLVILMRKTRPEGGKASAPIQEQFKPYAYLISQDEKVTRYPVTRTTWRIGRSRDNEMTLDDNSVSRRHAEIQRLENGSFMIYDHDSLNGVFVNGQKISRQQLNEGDIIEIGDFYLRFTEYPADFLLGEDTVMQQTRAPRS